VPCILENNCLCSISLGGIRGLCTTTLILLQDLKRPSQREGWLRLSVHLGSAVLWHRHASQKALEQETCLSWVGCSALNAMHSAFQPVCSRVLPSSQPSPCNVYTLDQWKLENRFNHFSAIPRAISVPGTQWCSANGQVNAERQRTSCRSSWLRLSSGLQAHLCRSVMSHWSPLCVICESILSPIFFQVRPYGLPPENPICP
jgi:hypothetical protein